MKRGVCGKVPFVERFQLKLKHLKPLPKFNSKVYPLKSYPRAPKEGKEGSTSEGVWYLCTYKLLTLYLSCT